jgi:hypothetical protein
MVVRFFCNKKKFFWLSVLYTLFIILLLGVLFIYSALLVGLNGPGGLVPDIISFIIIFVLGLIYFNVKVWKSLKLDSDRKIWDKMRLPLIFLLVAVVFTSVYLVIAMR